ncbi:hypothetical protein GOBAR_DD34411 [Gossypium barbadense]|nr:hypothetical protein GOBAR_DD34411 [Gossypium barbadense]
MSSSNQTLALSMFKSKPCNTTSHGPMPSMTSTQSSQCPSACKKPLTLPGVGEPAAVGHGDLGRSTVFINDVAFEVTVGPFNVREAFGDDAILINSSGQPVLTNEWGLTLQSLQHGGFYYLVRSLSPFSI